MENCKRGYMICFGLVHTWIHCNMNVFLVIGLWLNIWLDLVSDVKPGKYWIRIYYLLESPFELFFYITLFHFLNVLHIYIPFANPDPQIRFTNSEAHVHCDPSMCKPCNTIDNGPCKGYCAAFNSCGKQPIYQPFSNGMDCKDCKKEGNTQAINVNVMMVAFYDFSPFIS